MAAKQAEIEFARMCGKLNIWCHKWRNFIYCPHCNQPIFEPLIEINDTRAGDKRESIVDYLIFVGAIPVWVECKGKLGEQRLPFAEINPKQRNFLESWAWRRVDSWLFILLGAGRPPLGRAAWLIPWDHWRALAEIPCEKVGMKSLPWQPTGRKGEPYSFDSELSEYRLTWKDSGWTIPHGSPIQVQHPNILELPSLYEVSK